MLKLSMREKTPYCTAPFTSAVIDPDKGVRPCCTFDGRLGNLRDTELKDILASPQWKKVQDEVARGALPDGCVDCYKREKATGWSVRTSFNEARATRNGQWRKGITEIEVNSSNICNLACTHCNVDFSSRWAHLAAQLEEAQVPHYRRVDDLALKADPEGMVRQLAGLDLTWLDVVRFKGGEPMLNPDVPAVLRYLKDRGLLRQVRASFVTNGSVVNEDVRQLVAQAESVEMCISVDGMGKVQEYIRHGPSGIPRIERFIEAFAPLPKIEFNLSISIMAYNVFSLDRISQWWNAFRDRYPGKMRYPLSFHLEVIHPPILSVNVLQDATRKALIDKYRQLTDADYHSVIVALKQPFAGPRLHNDFIAYTLGIDKIRKTDVLDAVPELGDEMVPLDRTVETRHWWQRFSPPSADVEGDLLRKTTAFSKAGRYEQALRLYDRFFADQQNLPNSWPIRLHRAIVLGRLGRWPESLAELQVLVRRSPEKALVAVERARRDGQGLPVGLLAELARDEAALLQTETFRLLLEGLAHGALGNAGEAGARFDQALALDPGFMLARLARTEQAERVARPA